MAASEAPKPAPRVRRNGPRQLVLRIPRPTTYDRGRSIERRRTLAYSGCMPPHLRDRFTPGEQAVMFVISAEVRQHGRCERCLGEIAARAGVGRTTTQNAIRQAVKLGLVTLEERRRPGQRSLPNVIRIISREWCAWIARGPRQPGEGGGSKALDRKSVV